MVLLLRARYTAGHSPEAAPGSDLPVAVPADLGTVGAMIRTVDVVGPTGVLAAAVPPPRPPAPPPPEPATVPVARAAAPAEGGPGGPGSRGAGDRERRAEAFADALLGRAALRARSRDRDPGPDGSGR